MCVALQETMEQNRLHISSSMVCLTMDTRDAVRQLSGEMRGYSILVEPPKSLFGKSRRTFSGKLGGQQDDMVIALQLALYGMQIFQREPRYARFHTH
jgi:hypothetical protein